MVAIADAGRMGGAKSSKTFTQAVGVGIDSAVSLQATLALETGGRSLRNSNDLTAIIESARRDLSCYYLLGYSPPNAPDGLRHDLQVKISRSRRSGLPRDLDIRHRPFFIDRIP